MTHQFNGDVDGTSARPPSSAVRVILLPGRLRPEVPPGLPVWRGLVGRW